MDHAGKTVHTQNNEIKPLPLIMCIIQYKLCPAKDLKLPKYTGKHIGLGNDFVDKIPKAQALLTKINKFISN